MKNKQLNFEFAIFLYDYIDVLKSLLIFVTLCNIFNILNDQSVLRQIKEVKRHQTKCKTSTSDSLNQISKTCG